MLQKLSLNANSMAIFHCPEQEYVYTDMVSLGERILLSNSRTRPKKLRCVFNKGFLVNHWRGILNCSCKRLCFINSNRCIGRN